MQREAAPASAQLPPLEQSLRVGASLSLREALRPGFLRTQIIRLEEEIAHAQHEGDTVLARNYLEKHQWLCSMQRLDPRFIRRDDESVSRMIDVLARRTALHALRHVRAKLRCADETGDDVTVDIATRYLRSGEVERHSQQLIELYARIMDSHARIAWYRVVQGARALLQNIVSNQRLLREDSNVF